MSLFGTPPREIRSHNPKRVRRHRRRRTLLGALATAALSIAGLLGPAVGASALTATPASPRVAPDSTQGNILDIAGELTGARPAPAGRRTVANGTATNASAVGTDPSATPETINGAAVPAPPTPPAVRPAQRVVTGTARQSTSGGAMSLAADVTPMAEVAGKALLATTTTKTLLVYDATGPYAWLGEAYAMLTANLVSHNSSWVAHPVASYQPGELAGYNAVVYIGSTYDEPLPVAFLDDVTATTVPVVWMYDNIWQLTARDANFAVNRGFLWRQFDFATVAQVDYKGTVFTRDATNGAGIMDTVIYDNGKAVPVATAIRPDGTTFPWAVRSGNFTYVGEIPFAYMTHDDRYVAFADMLYDALAPATPVRHRALVRIEDVGPDADPTELRAVTNYLYSKKIPFSVAVYPRYRDPKGVFNGGKAEDYTLAKRPKVVAELKYMQTHGGTLLMHGYTHQYGNVANPYDGVSANDFEFYRAHIDASDNVVYDSPVAEDSTAWATGRVTDAANAFKQAGLTVPSVFEFPHYAGSVVDYRVMNTSFGTRYDRGLYFPGVLSGATIDYTRVVGQFFPYAVRDVYGSAIVPENVGNVEPEAFNNHPPRLPADIVASAKRNLVVRDGMASFFYHPYLGTAYLKSVVDGIQGLGYTFVPASATLS